MSPATHPAKPPIQVAGIRSLAEAKMLADRGVTHLGYPLVLDHHDEDLPAAEVRKIVAAVGDAATHVLITYLTSPGEILELTRALGVRWVQLHAPMSAAALESLRALAPDLTIIKSVVFGREDVEVTTAAALSWAPFVDWLITDTFDPDTGASGATGRTHDWALSAALARRSPRPVMLAGGLTPENVAQAITAVAPAGVDVHTGVEGPGGFKDPARVSAFVAASRAALEGLARE